MKIRRWIYALAFAAALLFGAVPAQAADGAYTIEAVSGLKGVIRNTGYVPVQIDITAAEDFKGTVEIPCGMRSWYENAMNMVVNSLLPNVSSNAATVKERVYTYRQEIRLAAGETKRLQFSIAVPDNMMALTIRLADEEGNTVAEQISYLDENRYNQRIVVGVAGGDSGETAEAIEAQQYGETLRCSANVVEMTVQEVPNDSRLFSQMDALVLVGISRNSLPADSRERLAEWEQGNEGVLIEASSSGSAVRQLLEYFNDERVEEAGIVTYSTPAQDELARIPVKRQPSLWLYGSVLVLYAVFAGPVLYLVLKRLQKQYFLWISIAGAAAGFTLLIGVLGAQTRMRAPFISYAEQYVQNGENVVQQVDFGIQAPYNEDYSLYVDRGFDLVPALEVNDMNTENCVGQGSSGELVDIEYEEECYKITMRQNAAFSPQYFTIHSQEQILGGVTADGTFTEAGLFGEVKNFTPYMMKDVFLLMPESIVYIGDMDSGSRKKLEDCKRYTYSISGLEQFFDEIPRFSRAEETKYLRNIMMNEIFDFYQGGSLKSYVIGIVQKEELDFQLDSGYETYGYSLYRATADIGYVSGGRIFCPFGQYRMQSGGEEYMEQQWPALAISTDGELVVYYDIEGTLRQIAGDGARATGISMYIPDYVESGTLIGWKGTISLFNREMKRYDQIAQWGDAMELGPYLGADGTLVVKYDSAFLMEPKRSEDQEMVIPGINVTGVVTENAQN